MVNEPTKLTAIPLSLPHQCKECDDSFKSAAKLSAHLSKVHHETTNRKKASKSKKDSQATNSEPSEKTISESSNRTAAPTAPSTETTTSSRRSEPAAVSRSKSEQMHLKLYQCEICEEIFSVQCFYKAHMAGHRKNGELPG